MEKENLCTLLAETPISILVQLDKLVKFMYKSEYLLILCSYQKGEINLVHIRHIINVGNGK